MHVSVYPRLYRFNAPISKICIPHDSPVHKEFGNVCFGFVQYMKRELQASLQAEEVGHDVL